MTVYRRPDPIPLRRTPEASTTRALAPARTESDDLNRVVAREIFRAVASGRFAIGSILPNEHQLAADLGVSRTVLREAIKGLASKGILETRRKRGTQVLDREQWSLLDPDLISWSRTEGGTRTSRDLWEAVAVVQAAVAAGISLHGHTFGIANAVKRFEGTTETEQRRSAFCQVLFEIASHGNQYLRSLNASCLRNLLKDDTAFLDEQIAQKGDDAFRDVLDAIKNRNPGSAYRAMQGLFAQAPALHPAH